jgi:predicted nucleic acid-binding protein
VPSQIGGEQHRARDGHPKDLKFYSPNAREQARAEVRDLVAWRPVLVDADVVDLGWRIQDRYQVSSWEALIISAARSTACGYLLTEDLQAGQKIEGVLVVNPFLHNPTSLPPI